MGPHLSSAGTFLIRTLFDLYILAIMLRFLFQWVRADFYNPVSRFLVKITNPPLVPLRRIIPGLRGIDFAAILLMLILQTGEFYLIGLLPGSPMPAFPGVLLWAVAALLSLLINVYIFGIIVLAIISWINPSSYNPAVGLLSQLTQPVLAPFRRMIPPTSGLDLSPLVALIVLTFIKLALINYFVFQAQAFAFPHAKYLF